MFNSAKSLANSVDAVKLVLDAARDGVKLLGNNIDYMLLAAFQNYIATTLKIVSQKVGRNYMDRYQIFVTTISNLKPYDQLKETINFLIKLAEELQKGSNRQYF
ncbi:hypothetical protein HDR61_04025 [bacterium]|nr:hypothetical protein [bacterium]